MTKPSDTADQRHDVPAEGDPTPFGVIHDWFLNEQNFFWQRFTAFSALHAGLLVIVASTSSAAAPVYLNIVGLVLAVAWVLIQWASLYYVNRSKDRYYAMCQARGIDPPPKHWLFKGVLSSTDIGVWVSVVTLIFWILNLWNLPVDISPN